MDEETKTFLIEHNLDSLVERFTENHIDYHILLVLSDKDVDELVKPLGLRIKLKSALKTLRGDLHFETSSPLNSKSVSEASTVILDGHDLSFVLDNNSSVIPAPSHSIAEMSVTAHCKPQKDDSANLSQENLESFPPRKALRKSDFFVDNLTVQELLQSRSKGQNIIRLYNEKCSFDSKDRRVLVELIVDALLDRYSSVRSDMLREVAKEIVSIFPNESIEIYFSYNPTISKNPRGKLVDKYKAERGYRKRNTSQESSKVGNCSAICDSPEVLENIKWLQHSQEPWDKVQSLWLKTFDSRKFDFASTQTLPQIFKKWPLLKHRAGYTLIESDFELMYPGKSGLLFKDFNASAKFLHQKITQVTSIEEWDAFENDENRTAAIIKKVPFLLQTTSFSSNKKTVRPSKAEAAEAFICTVTDVHQMKTVINERRLSSAQHGSSLQPQLVYVKDLDVYYSCVNEATYEIPNILKAIDISVKVHAVLNLEYDPLCKMVYTFFQRAFYGIKTSHDHVSPSLAVLMQELNA